ncbi:MAG: hypothetical protein AAGM67_00760 [Bacteroidota bacterium]
MESHFATYPSITLEDGTRILYNDHRVLLCEELDEEKPLDQATLKQKGFFKEIANIASKDDVDLIHIMDPFSTFFSSYPRQFLQDGSRFSRLVPEFQDLVVKSQYWHRPKDGSSLEDKVREIVARYDKEIEKMDSSPYYLQYSKHWMSLHMIAGIKSTPDVGTEKVLISKGDILLGAALNQKWADKLKNIGMPEFREKAFQRLWYLMLCWKFGFDLTIESAREILWDKGEIMAIPFYYVGDMLQDDVLKYYALEHMSKNEFTEVILANENYKVKKKSEAYDKIKYMILEHKLRFPKP